MKCPRGADLFRAIASGSLASVARQYGVDAAAELAAGARETVRAERRRADLLARIVPRGAAGRRARGRDRGAELRRLRSAAGLVRQARALQRRQNRAARPSRRPQRRTATASGPRPRAHRAAHKGASSTRAGPDDGPGEGDDEPPPSALISRARAREILGPDLPDAEVDRLVAALAPLARFVVMAVMEGTGRCR